MPVDISDQDHTDPELEAELDRERNYLHNLELLVLHIGVRINDCYPQAICQVCGTVTTFQYPSQPDLTKAQHKPGCLWKKIRDRITT